MILSAHTTPDSHTNTHFTNKRPSSHQVQSAGLLFLIQSALNHFSAKYIHSTVIL